MMESLMLCSNVNQYPECGLVRKMASNYIRCVLHGKCYMFSSDKLYVWTTHNCEIDVTKLSEPTRPQDVCTHTHTKLTVSATLLNIKRVASIFCQLVLRD